MIHNVYATDGDEFSEFLALAQRIGTDWQQSQGTGGNASIKLDDVLWVKASGARLADASKRSIFVPLDLPLLRHRLADGEDDPVRNTLRKDLNRSGLLPSIETILHALFPHRVVMHTHSVAAIAASVREDAEDFLAYRLNGIDWTFVPYARPGLPLTRAVAAALEHQKRNVLVIGNYGLVVAGDDCATTEALLYDVEARLVVDRRPAPAPDRTTLTWMADETPYFVPEDDDLHGTATDPEALRIAAGGSLCPNHVVLLGPAVTVLEPETVLVKRADFFADAPKLLAVRGAGILLHEDLTAAGQAMAGCLANVLALIPPESRVHYLSAREEAELLGWNANRLRQQSGR